jgi:hypothetical protein
MLIKESKNKHYFLCWTVRLIILVVFFYYCHQTCFLVVHADNGDTIVHVTKTGYCYHVEGCGHLRSDIEITLHDAVVIYGYNPCKDCNPPIYDGPDEPCVPMEKPGSNSGGTSSSSSTLTNSTSHDSNTSTLSNDSTTENRQSDISDSTDYIEYMLGIIVIGAIIWWTPYYFINTKKKKLAKQQFEKEREYYFNLYAHRDITLLVGTPQGVYLKNDFPCTTESPQKPYGDYTVYLAAKNPRVFHLNPNCGGANLYPTNYYFAYNLQHCKRCATGKIQLPTMEWYFKYLEIKKIKQKYNLP